MGFRLSCAASAALPAVVFCGSACAGPPVKVDVDAGPVRVYETKTSSTKKTTIVGPKGTRTITQDGDSTTTELPGVVERDAGTELNVTGPEDTGIVVERKVYVPGLQPGTMQVLTFGPEGDGVIVRGGPGTVTTREKSKTTTTPKVQVRIDGK